MKNLKELLQNGNIPFTDLLPDPQLIVPLALSLWYKQEILNPDFVEEKPLLWEDWKQKKSEEGDLLVEKIIGRMEANPETPTKFLNRFLTNYSWDLIKPAIKDIMLAEKKREMAQAEASIDAQLRNSEAEIRK